MTAFSDDLDNALWVFEVKDRTFCIMDVDWRADTVTATVHGPLKKRRKHTELSVSGLKRLARRDDAYLVEGRPTTEGSDQ